MKSIMHFILRMSPPEVLWSHGRKFKRKKGHFELIFFTKCTTLYPSSFAAQRTRYRCFSWALEGIESGRRSRIIWLYDMESFWFDPFNFMWNINTLSTRNHFHLTPLFSHRVILVQFLGVFLLQLNCKRTYTPSKRSKILMSYLLLWWSQMTLNKE